jgi:holo-[acyl-carrier protein] synthase
VQHAVGTDIVEIERVHDALARFQERFLRRVYTPAEVAFCRSRVPELAVRFAAKEAVMKALGTGRRGVSWRDIEVLSNGRGQPVVTLRGRAERRAQELGLDGLAISLSHSRRYAIATVVGAGT